MYKLDINVFVASKLLFLFAVSSKENDDILHIFDPIKVLRTWNYDSPFKPRKHFLYFVYLFKAWKVKWPTRTNYYLKGLLA